MYIITYYKFTEEGQMSNNFMGFHKQTNQFLFELQFCNTIAKQAENTEKYKKYITAPLNQLYIDLLDTINDFDVNFEAKPARCISTPYTDRRFSPAIPLKEYMYLRFRQSGKKTDMLGLYFDMGSEKYGYGLKIYKPTSKGMNLLREKICNNVEHFTVLADELADKGFEINGENYKKDHYPEMRACAAKTLLNMKCFSIDKSRPVNENVYSERLRAELSEAFFDLKDFMELLVNGV